MPQDPGNLVSQSYYDVAKAAIAAKISAGKPTAYQRLILVGKLDGDRAAFVSERQMHFKLNEMATGLLVVYTKVWLHVLECPVDQPSELGHHSETRVVSCAQVDERAFPFWAVKTVDGDEEHMEIDSSTEQQEVTRMIAEACVTMLGIGTALVELHKSEAKKAFDDFDTRFKRHLPPAGLVKAIAISDQVASAKEWTEWHGTADSTRLESGLVWPASVPLGSI